MFPNFFTHTHQNIDSDTIVYTPATNKRSRQIREESSDDDIPQPKRVHHQKKVIPNFQPIEYQGNHKGKNKQIEQDESSGGDDSSSEEEEEAQTRRRLSLLEGEKLYSIILKIQQEDNTAAKFIKSKNAEQWNIIEEEYNLGCMTKTGH